MKNKRILFAHLALICLMGCATTTVLVPEDAKIIEMVPFFEQNAFQCGPAALATVINYWYRKNSIKEHINVDSITSSVFNKRAKGVLTLDLELYAKELGFKSLQYSASIEELKRSIDENIPVIILVDYGKAFFQQNHFMVVKGYTQNGIIINTEKKENHLILNESLTKIWNKTGYWALIVKP